MTEDEHAITQVILRYASAVDRLDREGIAATFHPDASLHMGPMRTTGASAPDVIINALKSCERSMHFVSNILIEVEGDTAKSEAYLRSILFIRREGQPYTRELISRLADRHEKRDGRWAIIERVALYEWSRIDPVVEEMQITDDWVRSVRNTMPDRSRQARR